MSVKKDPRIDAYIANAQPFARPILKAIRKAVHQGCPDVEEALKWSSPSFMYKGILCGMAAFKAHATFGFWDHELLLRKGLKPADEKAMGQFGRLMSVDDLPSEKELVRLVKAAVALRDSGAKRAAKPRPARDRTLEVPDYFMAALRKNEKALATFEGFSYTNKKEYVQWVTEAKGEDTRKRRLDTAIAWMTEGKVRNWKYINC
jgi:uncharacterized protein YdeI (YjbR/CyaY-like superfamily)